MKLLILAVAIAISIGVGNFVTMPIDAHLLKDLKSYQLSQLQPSLIFGGSFLSVIAFVVAQRLEGKARIIGSIQLWVVALLVSYLGRDMIQTAPMPVSYMVAIALGTLAGSYERIRLSIGKPDSSSDLREKLQSKELIEARLELIKQDEVDRRVLAADLHDQVLHDLKLLRQRIADTKELTPQSVEQLDGLVAQSIVGVRTVMDNLSPVDIEHLGLTESLHACIEKSAEKAGLSVSFESTGASVLDANLTRVEATLLYRLVQESMNNVLKHASATKVMGQVKVEDGKLVVRVVDDGQGIDQEKFRSESRGMRYMRQRADLIGATIAWKSRQSGSGTIVEIRFLRDAEHLS